jgi:hypothetical protein
VSGHPAGSVSPRVRVLSATAVDRADPRDRQSVNAVRARLWLARRRHACPAMRPMPRYHPPDRWTLAVTVEGACSYAALRGRCSDRAALGHKDRSRRFGYAVARASVDDVRPPPPTGGRSARARAEASSRSRPPPRQRSSRAADRQTSAAGARTGAGHVQQLINRRRARALRTASPYPSLLK